jgi:amino acid adenylation domain-containing protein
VQRVDNTYGVSPSVFEVSKNPTILAIENSIIEKTIQSRKDGSDSSAESSHALAPLSDSQKGVYFDQIKNPGKLIYNVPSHIVFPKEISIEAVIQAISGAFAIHPSLNYIIYIKAGEIIQEFSGNDIVIDTLGEITSKEFEEYRDKFVRPFDVSGEHLYRFQVAKVDGAVHFLQDTHHLISDGVSRNIFLRDIVSILEGKTPEKERFSLIDNTRLESTFDKTSSKKYYATELKDFEASSSIEPDIDQNATSDKTQTPAHTDGGQTPTHKLQSRTDGGQTPPNAGAHQNQPHTNAQEVSQTPAHERACQTQPHTKAQEVSQNPAEARMQEVSRKVNTSKLNDFCKKTGLTASNVMLAATGYTVSRWSVSRNAYICFISSGRENPKLQNTVGMFVKTLPVNIELPKDFIPVKDYCKSANEKIMGAIANQSYSLSEISADFGFSPDIVFTSELGVIEEYSINGEKVECSLLPLGEPKFKVSILAVNHDGETYFDIQYDSSLYTKPLMEQFAKTLSTVLDSIIADETSDMRKISLMSKSDFEALNRFNDTSDESSELPEEVVNLGEKLLHRRLENIVSLMPQKTALIASNETLTYAEFERECNKVANALILNGVGIEDKVCILLHRTSNILISMFGCLKAGACYIPLDPEYPNERVQYILENSDAKYIITSYDSATAHYKNTLFIEDLRAFPDTKRPSVDVKPNNLAYMIYTSGSTGRPKGVMIEHHSISTFLTPVKRNKHAHALAKDASKAVAIQTVSFDNSMNESHGPICNGTTLVYADDNQSKNPVELAKLFEKTGADAFGSTPSVVFEFISYKPFYEHAIRCKTIQCGGEVFTNALRDMLLKGAAEIGNTLKLHNGYGPTETTVSPNESELSMGKRITVGEPVFNVKEYVVDYDMNVLPAGIPGELCIAGECVGRGYHKLDEETRKKFTTLNKERVFRTGDFAKLTFSGEIDFIGRRDNQVKLRGLRIELGEINSVLSSLEPISASEVVIKKINGEEHICAYYVSDIDIHKDWLKKELSEKLTAYMIPTAYMQIEKIPKTPSGKNDLKALPDPEVLQSEREVVDAKNDVEREFIEIFKKVLNRDIISADDNFFEIGGTSLAVTKIIVESNERGISEIGYGDVFKNPTPQKLASFVVSKNRESLSDYDISAMSYDYTDINPLLTKGDLEQINASEPGADSASSASSAQPSGPAGSAQPVGSAGSAGSAQPTQPVGSASSASSAQPSGPAGSAQPAQLSRPLGNVLLSGATGFLGIHILRELIRLKDTLGVKTINAFIRKGEFDSVEKRLKYLALYYFGADLRDHIDKTIRVIEGDVTGNFSGIDNIPIDTIINAAANVRHFAVDNMIMDVNFSGVKNFVALAKNRKARLIHISTLSVAGVSIDGVPDTGEMLTEDRLYFGQRFAEKQYVFSKFLAERGILESMRKDGLDAKIMRVGNLMGRTSDGKFQINMNSNTFVGRLGAYAALGKFPYSQYSTKIDLTPIDECAQAILLLSTAPDNFHVFHPFNVHSALLGDLIVEMRELGLDVDFASDREYKEALESFGDNPKVAEKLTPLIAYQDSGNTHTVFLQANSSWTANALLHKKWVWSQISDDYMKKLISYLIGVGYFT